MWGYAGVAAGRYQPVLHYQSSSGLWFCGTDSHTIQTMAPESTDDAPAAHALTDDQLELLWRADRDYDDPVLVEKQTIDAVGELFGKALKERGISDPSALDADALVAQFASTVADDDEGSAIEALANQHPETGGDGGDRETSSETEPQTQTHHEAMVDPTTGRVDVEALSASTFQDIKRDLMVIEEMEERTPDHVARKRREVAARLGCDPDEVPTRSDFSEAYQ